MRKSLGLNHSDISQERTYTNKHGDVAVMNTAKIGKRTIQDAEITQAQGADQAAINPASKLLMN